MVYLKTQETLDSTGFVHVSPLRREEEQAIQKLEQEWAAALMKGDQARIDRVESADWTLADPEANSIT